MTITNALASRMAAAAISEWGNDGVRMYERGHLPKCLSASAASRRLMVIGLSPTTDVTAVRKPT